MPAAVFIARSPQCTPQQNAQQIYEEVTKKLRVSNPCSATAAKLSSAPLELALGCDLEGVSIGS
jgi:hypothetical protein